MNRQKDSSITDGRLVKPTRFGFLLINDFTLISLASAVEPLRMANRILGKPVYQWKTVSETGQVVQASDGLLIGVNQSLEDRLDFDAMIVCGGIDVEKSCKPPLLRWLKEMPNRYEMNVGAICTGSYVLAAAGLLDGYRCSIHWENLRMLRECFPRVLANNKVFTIDRDRYTSSGGTAPIDMMLSVISMGIDEKTSATIAEEFICDRIRYDNEQQRIPLWHVLGVKHSRLIATVELMESNLEKPLKLEELSDHAGVSLRQLERLFKKYLSCTPARYYLELRLKRAQQLLRSTNLRLHEISFRCGFISVSHFCRCYKKQFGCSPHRGERIQENAKSA